MLGFESVVVGDMLCLQNILLEVVFVGRDLEFGLD